MIDATSRYRDTPVLRLQAGTGDVIPYLARRCLAEIPIPGSGSSALRVQAGDRPDLLAAQVLGDPLAFWRIAEANRVLDPWSLTASPGAVIRLPSAAATFRGGG